MSGVLIGPIFVLLGVLVVLLLGTQVILSVYNARRINVATKLRNFVNSLLIAAAMVWSTVLQLGALIANNFFTVATVLTSLSVLIILADVHTAYHANYLPVVDAKTSEVVLPFYRDIILEVANVVRIAYDASVCWYNAAASTPRVLLGTLWSLLFECTVAQWRPLTRAVLDSFTAFGHSLTVFVADDLMAAPFRWQPIVANVSYIVGNTTAPLTCVCQDFFFVFRWTELTIAEPTLHQAIDSALNVPLVLTQDLVKVALALLTGAIFDGPHYGCDAATLNSTALAACIDSRPTNLLPTFTFVAQTLNLTTIWLDDAAENVVVLITDDNNADIVPNIFRPVGSLLTAIVYVVENIVALSNRLVSYVFEVIFGGEVDADKFFFQRLRSFMVINALFEFAADVETVFAQIDVDFIVDFGLFIGNICRALALILEFLLELLKVVATDTLNQFNGITISSFLSNYPFENIRDYLVSAGAALGNVASELNIYLGQWAASIIDIVASLLDMIVEVAAEIGGLKRSISSVMTNVVQPKWTRFKTVLRSFAVATGNLVRQFEPRPNCDGMRDPFDVINLGMNGASSRTIDGVFCAFGATIEDFLWTGSGLIEWFFDILLAALGGQPVTTVMSQTNPNSPGNIDRKFYLRYESWVRSVSSIVPNFFAYINSPVVSECITGTTADPSDKTLVDVIEQGLRLLGFIVEGIVLVVRTFAAVISSSVDVCIILIKPIYNIFTGRIIELAVDVIQWIICLADVSSNSSGAQDFNVFLGTLSELFGVDGDFISGICSIWDNLARAFEIILALFTDFNAFIGAIGDAIGAIFTCIGNFLGTFFEGVFRILSSFFSQFGNCIRDFFTQSVGGCLCSGIANAINTVFGKLCSGGVCLTCSLSCTGSPASCNTFAQGNFGTIDWNNITTGFENCATSIEFDVRRHTADDNHVRVQRRSANGSLYSNMTISEEVIYLLNQHCPALVPIAPYALEDDPTVAFIPFNVTALFPPEARMMWADTLEANMTRFQARTDFRRCLASVASARALERLLMIASADVREEVIPRLWLYDYFERFRFGFKLLTMATHVVQYEYQRVLAFVSENQTMVVPTWFEYMNHTYNGTVNHDLLVLRGGWLITQLTSALVYDAGWQDKINSTQVTGLARTMVELFRSMGPGLIRSVRNIFGRNGVAQQSIAGLQAGRLMMSTLQLGPIAERAMLGVRTVAHEFTIRMPAAVMASDTVRRITNSLAQWGQHHRVRQVMQNVQLRRAALAPARMIGQINDRFRFNVDLWNHTLPSSPQPSSSSLAPISSPILQNSSHDSLIRRDNLLGVELCTEPGSCLECSYFERVVDDFIDLFYMCVVDNRRNPVQVNGSLVLASDEVPQVPLSWYAQANQNNLSTSALRVSYPIRESVHKLYLNHGTPEETAMLAEIQAIEQYHGIGSSRSQHQHSKRDTTATNVPEVGQRASARASGSDKLRELVDDGLSVTGWLFRQTLALIERLFGVLKVRQGITNFVDSLAGGLETNDSGFGYWFQFVRRCDYFDHPRCNVGRVGLGLVRGFWIALLTFVIVTALFVAVSRMPVFGAFASFASVLLPWLWLLLFLPLWQTLAYYMSPWCTLPSPLPIVANCLADDAYVLMRNAAVPCINYTNIGLPGITNDNACPPPWARCISLANFNVAYNITDPVLQTLPGAQGVGSCPAGMALAKPRERLFVDCSQAPYRFVGGFRNLFFFLRHEFPNTYDSFINTQFTPMRWVLDLRPIATAAKFDFGPSGVANDTWHSCQKLTGPSWVTVTVLVSGAVFLFFAILILSVVALLVFALIFLAVADLWATMIGILTRYQWNMSVVQLK